MNPEIYKETKWLRFYIVGRKPKTIVLRVENTSNQLLGSIQWHGAWRQYTYTTDPQAEITFNNQCLQDIADVLTSLNTEQRNLSKKEKPCASTTP